MRRRVSTTEAWRLVAEAFDTPWEHRTATQRAATQYGLCWAICYYTGSWKWYLLLGRLRHKFGIPATLWWPLERRYDGERAIFAGLLAAMTQRERDRLERGL
jgi:hypothetical protein